AGDPTLDATGGLLAAVDRGGADVIELGVPFSDPLADGPVIQRASERGLRAGATLRKILERLPRWREAVKAPVILFTYYNPVLQYEIGRASCRERVEISEVDVAVKKKRTRTRRGAV